jgi:hypothetical protein
MRDMPSSSGILNDPELTSAEKIQLLPNDLQRAQYCRAMAEKKRVLWFDAQREFVRQALEDPTLQKLTEEQRVQTGEDRWSKDVRSKALISAEQMYWGWMSGYLAWAQYNLPVNHPGPKGIAATLR